MEKQSEAILVPVKTENDEMRRLLAMENELGCSGLLDHLFDKKDEMENSK